YAWSRRFVPCQHYRRECWYRIAFPNLPAREEDTRHSVVVACYSRKVGLDLRTFRCWRDWIVANTDRRACPIARSDCCVRLRTFCAPWERAVGAPRARAV